MAALLTIRFLAELGMLACLAWGGWQRADGVLVSLALAAAFPAAAGVVWGRWIAPRAPHRLSDPRRLAVEVTLFAAASLLVLGAGPMPHTAVAAVAVWAAFLVSIPSRGHEPTPQPR